MFLYQDNPVGVELFSHVNAFSVLFHRVDTDNVGENAVCPMKEATASQKHSNKVEPRYNEVLGKTNDLVYPSKSKIYGKVPLYNETSL